jgi:hypothetical protein
MGAEPRVSDEQKGPDAIDFVKLTVDQAEPLKDKRIRVRVLIDLLQYSNGKVWVVCGANLVCFDETPSLAWKGKRVVVVGTLLVIRHPVVGGSSQDFIELRLSDAKIVTR